ncbi:uncharacterized protein K452DRAFT_78705 [Aplosporella prunicola CBS 121167]|uniref:Uncharacterized protein n=1 Tax=Aplosporella prunicola CBS 121167 TaxID=1176127 RepID=A0A6A6B506_9PEZI|nr:uncharacterized protein K452DRAFT_78705 [Aplosporella prunicola CBS 121167]KAF2138956.1 hypothetical protein K452DRAFT_78705 [Aplosporella prunicola CBS 121167]
MHAYAPSFSSALLALGTATTAIHAAVLPPSSERPMVIEPMPPAQAQLLPGTFPPSNPLLPPPVEKRDGSVLTARNTTDDSLETSPAGMWSTPQWPSSPMPPTVTEERALSALLAGSAAAPADSTPTVKLMGFPICVAWGVKNIEVCAAQPTSSSPLPSHSLSFTVAPRY